MRTLSFSCRRMASPAAGFSRISIKGFSRRLHREPHPPPKFTLRSPGVMNAAARSKSRRRHRRRPGRTDGGRGAGDAGVQVDVYDAMPSVGRKFLLAGKGGLNLTHSRAARRFRRALRRARARSSSRCCAPSAPDALRAWAHGLGIETFVGTSGRVFPADMKAAPLLRAWLHRLRERGVRFHMRHRWRAGPTSGGAALRDARTARSQLQADAVVLALGGASWPRLGSDGAWVPLLQRAASTSRRCGRPTAASTSRWSEHFAAALRRRAAASRCVLRFATTAAVARAQGRVRRHRTPASKAAWSTRPRRRCATRSPRTGSATLLLDLLPGPRRRAGCSASWRTRAARARWRATSRAGSASTA